MVTKGKQPSNARGTRTPGNGTRTTAAGRPKTASRPNARPNARRKPSKAVYRRRRLVVFGALFVVLALLVAGAITVATSLAGKTEPSGSATSPGTQAQNSQSPVPGTSGAASPSTKPTPVCDLNLVTVTATTDKPSYAVGQNPVLGLKVTNGGSAPCQVNVGTSQMEFLVMSGADRIFSSRDCQAKSEDLVKTIPPGKSESANFGWQRNRTLEGCNVVNAKPGAGTYVYTASLGNKVSPKAVFSLR